MMTTRWISIVGAVALSGCATIGDDLADATGSVEQADTVANGVSINGVSVNGVSVNGVSVNGVSVNGVSVNGVSVNGGQLVGTSSSGAPLSGTEMVGAILTGTLATGDTLQLRIDSAQLLVADAWAYHVSKSTNGSSWSALCTNPSNTDGLAVVIAGVWDYRADVPGAGGWIDDPTQFTFGCRKAAIAKCVELGYRPWATVGGVLLQDHLTACVRMIRGDYCGDGHAWTQDGNLIDVYDALGIQTDTQTWPIDAAWSVAGATCATLTRTDTAPPSCYTGIVKGTCSFKPGVLLIDEYSLAPTGTGPTPTTTRASR